LNRKLGDPVRILADVAKCQGYGNCAALDAEHFDLNDDGLVVLLRTDVAATEVETAQAAVRSCPAEAIWLGDDAG
jgi:ferredoxin